MTKNLRIVEKENNKDLYNHIDKNTQGIDLDEKERLLKEKVKKKSHASSYALKKDETTDNQAMASKYERYAKNKTLVVKEDKTKSTVVISNMEKDT